MTELHFRTVTEGNWNDMVELFESRGGPKSCWCMVWRAQGAEARSTNGAHRRAALESRVSAGIPIGLLGYVDQEPVAWCSIAPRSTYRSLGGLDDSEEKEGQIWSLVCFFIKRPYRGLGFSHRVIDAAVEHARAGGAKVVEAYPVEPGSPSYRFMGFVPSFEACGFRLVGTAGSRRKVMRKRLS